MIYDISSLVAKLNNSCLKPGPVHAVRGLDEASVGVVVVLLIRDVGAGGQQLLVPAHSTLPSQPRPPQCSQHSPSRRIRKSFHPTIRL